MSVLSRDDEVANLNFGNVRIFDKSTLGTHLYRPSVRSACILDGHCQQLESSASLVKQASWHSRALAPASRAVAAVSNARHVVEDRILVVEDVTFTVEVGASWE